MRRGNLILCEKCKKIIGGISPKAMKDTPKRLLNSKGMCCEKCEENNKLK